MMHSAIAHESTNDSLLALEHSNRKNISAQAREIRERSRHKHSLSTKSLQHDLIVPTINNKAVYEARASQGASPMTSTGDDEHHYQGKSNVGSARHRLLVVWMK